MGGGNARYDPYKRQRTQPYQQQYNGAQAWEEQARTQNLKQTWACLAKDTVNLNKQHKPPEDDKW